MKLRYKDYITTLKQDQNGIWHGRVAGIQDVVTFEAKTPSQAEQEFRKAIDAYLNFCHRLGRSPHKPAPRALASRLLRKLFCLEKTSRYI